MDADAIHPQANVEKMSAGIPLNDADREPWLKLVRTAAEHTVAEQERDPNYTGRLGTVVACSALKRYYRDILRGLQKPESLEDPIVPANPEALPTYFVYIKGERALLEQRMTQRHGHFMKSTMLQSQLQTLESPEGEHGAVVVPLDVDPGEQVKRAREGLAELIGPL